MANKKFDNDPVILELRERYPKSGPDPLPGENLDAWAERFMEYVRNKHPELKEPEEKKNDCSKQSQKAGSKKNGR